MMAQFVFGLLAGIVVGLVMEWVIDWTGLLPKTSISKQASQKRAQQNSSTVAAAKSEEVLSLPNGSESSTSAPSTDEG
jgi:hypothetical protein